MTKDRLRAYVAQNRELKQIEGRIRRLRAERDGLHSPDLDGMPKNHAPSSPTETLAVRLAELEVQYLRARAALASEQAEIECAIESLADSTERTLMRARYLDGLEWEAVCVLINYSWRQTHRLHARVLSKLGVEK